DARPDLCGEPWFLLGQFTEVTALPAETKQLADIFAHFGAKLENVSVGCFVMSGTYGHEVKIHANSFAIYALSWQNAMNRLP
ncbi:hypothetical protein Q6248_28885, partial [Klebsiella pneumoniae]|uniref:hypothetical protein n=1 Tax=Klebsiella pneumoniae TaxID=573 RepID=UPI002730C5C3